MLFLAPIVEGHGEVEALPALLHRIADASPGRGPIRVNQPIRVKSGSFLNDESQFRRHVQLAAAKAAQADGIVLILLDCDDDCPAELGPALLRRASAVRPDVRIVVALAHREYESWFVLACRSLRGEGGLRGDAEPPGDTAGLRDAKRWLGHRMTAGRYDPVTHQLSFTRRFDLTEARANRSFDRLYGRIRALLEAAPGPDASHDVQQPDR